MSLAGLPKLSESLEQHGLTAKKSFGQHFLLDLNVTGKIARLAAPLNDRVVVEVGPGPGGLTRALLETDAAHVVAVEKDARFLPLLGELADAAGGRLTVVEADALQTDEPGLAEAAAPGRRWVVVSNLPYNVGTPLLVKWLLMPVPPESLTLMFQKEVALRIVAAAGADDYGRLAVLAQATACPTLAMTLPARAFTPPPRVDSAVVHLTMRPDRPSPTRLGALQRVTEAGFGQRRKMLRSSLKSVGGEALCAAVDIDPSVRAETVPVEGWLALADALLARG